MPKIGKPEINWDPPCLELKLIRQELIALDNLKVNKTDEDHKVTWIKGRIGDKGTQSLRKNKWEEGEWENGDLVIQRLKDRKQPKSRNQKKKYRSELSHFKQTSETFTEFWTELKRKYEIAKGTTNIQCEEHRNCQDCHQRCVDDEMMSYMSIGVRE